MDAQPAGYICLEQSLRAGCTKCHLYKVSP